MGKWGENEEMERKMERKWKENKEMERERYSFFVLNEYFFELNTGKNQVLNSIFELNFFGNSKMNFFFNWIFLKN